MNNPLLSVCIATYNRADYIGETLDSIIPQLGDDTELLIVDGASTDDTESIVRQYVEKDARIRYERLSAKGGVDQDYNKAAQLACGKYCWLFTDDDLLRQGAIGAVKSALAENPALVVVNAEVFNRDWSATLEKRRMKIDKNRIYASEDMDVLFMDTLDYLSFIGAVVIRRDLWLQRDCISYFGTEFIHVGVIFQKCLPGDAIVIAEPYIMIRFGNGQWTPRGFDIWMFKWPDLVWSFEHISKSAKRHVCARKPWMNLKILVGQRSLGAYNEQTYYRYFSNAKVNFGWKICAWLIARTSRRLVIGLHYCYSRIRGQKYRASFDNYFPGFFKELWR